MYLRLQSVQRQQRRQILLQPTAAAAVLLLLQLQLARAWRRLGKVQHSVF